MKRSARRTLRGSRRWLDGEHQVRPQRFQHRGANAFDGEQILSPFEWTVQLAIGDDFFRALLTQLGQYRQLLPRRDIRIETIGQLTLSRRLDRLWIAHVSAVE